MNLKTTFKPISAACAEYVVWLGVIFHYVPFAGTNWAHDSLLHHILFRVVKYQFHHFTPLHISYKS